MTTQLHPAAQLTGGRIPAHVPGAYPRLSCCGGPVILVADPWTDDPNGPDGYDTSEPPAAPHYPTSAELRDLRAGLMSAPSIARAYPAADEFRTWIDTAGRWGGHPVAYACWWDEAQHGIGYRHPGDRSDRIPFDSERVDIRREASRMRSRAYRLALLGTPAEYQRLCDAVEGGLHYLRGNAAPYFSLTYTQHRAGMPHQCQAGGAGHETIAEVFGDRFADLAALHQSDIDGVPMHAEANGWYHLAGALGGAGERFHAGNAETYGRPRDPLAGFARHCRISIEEAEAIRAECMGVAQPIAPGRPYNWESARATMAAILRGMRPRWKAEAEACIARHHLRVFGDPWPVPEADRVPA